MEKSVSPLSAPPLSAPARVSTRTALRDWSIDRIAIGLSGLCLVHCVASAVFFASVASVGAVLLDPLFHEIGLIIAIGFALVSLVRGMRMHGHLLPFGVGCAGLGMMGWALTMGHDNNEILVTMVGVLIVALAHDLNVRAAR